MQTAGDYVAIDGSHKERTLPLPANLQEIARYVEQLLTPDEERLCDMATD